MAGLGIDLRVRSDPAEWTRYDDVDGVLAVREITPYDLSIKPPTKFLNAWRAGVVPLLGPEPAYRQVGEPGRDYLEVDSVADVLAALGRLKAEPGTMDALLAAGRAKAAEYTDDAVAQAWVRVLSGPVRDHFLFYRRHKLRSALAFPLRVVRHRRERKYFFDHI